MKTKSLILGALFCAFGVLFPPIFHLFGATAGGIFLPMHIPVLTAGFLLGPVWGLIVGLFSPILSTFITGMPPMAKLPFMVFELMAYGFFSGLIYRYLPKNKFIFLYPALIGAQIAGRIVNLLCVLIAVYLLGLKSASLPMVWTSLVAGLPGIILQLIFVPLLVKGIKIGVHIHD